MKSAGASLFPNMFILLVAPPGVGKTEAIKSTTALWKKVPDLQVAPDSVTKSSFLDRLNEAKRVILLSPIQMDEFNSLQVAADELGVFIPAHDLDFLSHLNKIYDCPEDFAEERRTQKNTLFIPKPIATILAGTQPGFMASIFPEEAWGMGFASRLFMIYSSIPVKVKLWDTEARDTIKGSRLLSDLKAIMQLYGQMEIEVKVKELIQEWDDKGRQPVPVHSKLEHYNTRRIMHLLKLSMITSISRSSEMVIRVKDFERALAWMIEAEMTMPDVFRNMTQKSDNQVIQELHQHLWQLYQKEKKPIHESRLFNFLRSKVPSDRVEKVMTISERAHVIVRMAGESNMYRPATKDELGLE